MASSGTGNVRSEATVKARMHQLESAVASAEHLSKHPDQLRRRQQNKLIYESELDDDDTTSDFADLLKNLTLDATTGKSGTRDALKAAFSILDVDGDGFITLSDLQHSLQGLDDEEEDDEDEKLTDEDLMEMLLAADVKGIGRISFENFVRIVEPKNKANEQKSKR